MQQRCSKSAPLPIPRLTLHATYSGGLRAIRRRFYVADRRIARGTRRGQLSTREAAARLGVHERTLRRYIVCGQIACRRLPGGHYRIAPEAIEDFWARAEQPTARRSPSCKTLARRGPHTRRTRLADEARAERDYDLSPGHLAELRARVAAATNGGSR